MCSSYSAALTSFLAVKIHKPPFRNLREMVFDTNFNIVTVDGTSYVQEFSVSKKIENPKLVMLLGMS